MKINLLLAVPMFAICTLSYGEINIDNNLAEQMKTVGPNGTVSALVYLDDQVDIKALSTSITEARLRFHERHQLVVETLQTTAIDSQVSILNTLENFSAKGSVSRIQPFWISNVIRVDAAPSIIHQLSKRSDVLQCLIHFRLLGGNVFIQFISRDAEARGDDR